ncbi:MAG: HpcH/HpaI aldolase family protein [Limnochordia bacterium]
MRKNILRERLREGKPTVGTHIHSTWPGLVEVIGHTGVIDYVEFLAQYSSFDLTWFDDFARLTELHNMSSMVKVDQSLENFLAQRAVGSGIQSILFTDVKTAEGARNCIKAVRPETPDGGGTLGCTMRRDVSYVLECGSAAFVQASKDIVAAFMIEKKEAVENLEEILAVEGVDMVQFGPCDYSITLGKPGYGGSPEVKEVEMYVAKTALKMGVQPRVELHSFDDAKRYLDIGVRHFCIGWDVVTIFNWLKEHAGQLQDVLKG